MNNMRCNTWLLYVLQQIDSGDQCQLTDDIRKIPIHSLKGIELNVNIPIYAVAITACNDNQTVETQDAKRLIIQAPTIKGIKTADFKWFWTVRDSSCSTVTTHFYATKFESSTNCQRQILSELPQFFI
uniref:Uncharacterized protein n=1 Tax=Glossina palpalis gambiensis TaxID=67801 RepID=A0A1B0C1C5_9MUSC